MYFSTAVPDIGGETAPKVKINRKGRIKAPLRNKNIIYYF
jgi:hypothetical protein